MVSDIMSLKTHITVLMVGLTLSVAGCSWLPVEESPRADKLAAAERQHLDNSLRVASASVAAGQLQAAERLYKQLSRHFPSAPEPRLGRAYLAMQAGDFTRAGNHFVEAEERSAAPAAKAEALLGAGRASLGKEDVAAAKVHFLAGSKLAAGTPAEPWIANGLGVIATIEGDHERARMRYDEALKSSASDPLITANLVRALAQAGEEGAARRLYAQYSASHWLHGDGAALSEMLARTSAQNGAPGAETALPNVPDGQQTGKGGPLASAATQGATRASGAQVQVFSARSHAGAMGAWKLLSSAEKDLFGSLTPRVVKAETRGKGVVYRLRVGPLADKVAAKRLCGLLKGRGRDCFVPAGKWTTDNGTVVRRDQPRGSEPINVAQAVSTDDWPNPAAQPGPAGERAAATLAAPAAGSSGATPEAGDAPGVHVQLFSARSRSGAMGAWNRLLEGERDLLGSLTPRVVKAEIPKKGVVYRLRAGPLADSAAAKRLCGLLKGRGRDCFVPAAK